jgi:ABC-type ATPase involved in cell division
MLQAFQKNGTAVIISTHDPRIFADLKAHALQLQDHKLLDKSRKPSKVSDISDYQKSRGI